jgi:hypothetical protein
VTSPQTIQNYVSNVDNNGNPLWYQMVAGRGYVTFQSLINNPLKGAWNEPPPNGSTTPGPDGKPVAVTGVWDDASHNTLSAEAVTWRYVDSTGTPVDLQSILMVLWELARASVPAAQFAAAVEAASVARTPVAATPPAAA